MMHDTKPVALPSWLRGLGSAFLIFHLIALAGLVLSAGSQWGPEGELNLPGPQFAMATSEYTNREYLRPLRMTHNYHFETNKPAAPGVKFEIRLYDARGSLVKKLDFPESIGNPWVRHRLDRVAQNLFRDVPIQVRPGMLIWPIGPDGKPQKPNLIEIWLEDPAKEPGQDQVLELKRVTENEIPRNQPVHYGPSEWSKKLAEAYVRYQFRLHGPTVAEGELIRISRQGTPPPLFLFSPDQQLPPRGRDFPDFKVSFGKIKNETPAH